MSSLPPQRRGPASSAGSKPKLSPAEGARQAAQRLGLTCFYAGQKVPGFVGCVACQFQIRNRGILPTCPQCGEIVWAWLDQGPAPTPDEAGGAEHLAQQRAALAEKPKVEEGVRLEGPTGPVKVEENVKLEP